MGVFSSVAIKKIDSLTHSPKFKEVVGMESDYVILSFINRNSCKVDTHGSVIWIN